MAGTAPEAFSRLFAIIQRLRAPDGCPWDREQTPRSLRSSLIEEAWECVTAIDAGDDANMEEELGDLYLLVTMLAWMKEQNGSFSVRSALDSISDKLIRRHPHVFAGAAAETPREVVIQWDHIKAGERSSRGAADVSSLDRVPASLPPLEKSLELQRKAADVGFDWPGPSPVWDKIEEEARELRIAAALGNSRRVEEEAGDLLFSVVNLLRQMNVNPSLALNATNRKFERRFREVERLLREEGVQPRDAGLARLDRAWDQVKGQERGAGPAGEKSSK
jgi:MazG family protein